MQISRAEYAQKVQKNSPKSRKFRDIFAAFTVGGLICAIGEIFYYAFSVFGCDEKISRASASIMIVLFTAILTGIGVFDKIAKFAGAGTLVPISGFANAVVSPAVEFKTEGFILGLGANIFKIAGPVILYGVSTSVIYGVIYWVTTLF
ncbi:MAG: stage V sporulation protein AC [Clostridia bacterium]|nr:stage V sporulation protein AC [Clostridia bacterium]